MTTSARKVRACTAFLTCMLSGSVAGFTGCGMESGLLSALEEGGDDNAIPIIMSEFVDPSDDATPLLLKMRAGEDGPRAE